MLARVKFERDRHEREAELTKMTAWHAAICIGNSFSKEPKQTFEEVFPKPIKKKKTDPAKLQAQCRKHRLVLTEV